MSLYENLKPEVGMGVTVQVGSDTYGGTITAVSESGKYFKFVKDHDPERILRASLQTDRRWTYKFGPRPHHKWYVYVGERVDHRDPSY